MNILFVTPRLPYPPLKGDQVVPFNRLRLLSEKHEITLISLYEKEEELQGLGPLRNYCKAIVTVKLPKWRSMLNVLTGAPISTLPMQVLYYQSATFQKQLMDVISKNSFDLIHAYMLRVAPYLSFVGIPKILDLIDSMQLNLERRIALERIPNRWVYQEEFRRVARYESNIGKDFDQLILVAEKDRLYISNENVVVIPLGVDTDIFKPKSKANKDPAIVFSGNMGYSPNIQAISWFVEKCFENIQTAIPHVSLIIAGGPSGEIQCLEKKKGIKVTGFVDPRSMPDIIGQADIAIAPMQSGSGMQFKILEAMACGLPVVATNLGLGTISAVNGESIVIADSPEQFTEACVTLLTNYEFAEEVGRCARELVVKKYSWERNIASVNEIYSTIA